MPELDERGIDAIREYHFLGGSKVTDLKGTFRADLTNVDLHKIFVTWAKQGAKMTRRIMVVCSKWGDVITMFPIP
ncbi:hypothetical protein [Streptomyces cellulosae]|uniref:Uncharacterized protein n=1 Tax=Streptomyces cellulosae TaxID=1968 RepID=A0ABW7XW18_STRCE